VMPVADSPDGSTNPNADHRFLLLREIYRCTVLLRGMLPSTRWVARQTHAENGHAKSIVWLVDD
jgi:hypothetical protein